MFALLRKEINSFLSSLAGYISIIVFLIANGLFIWVFPGEFNILENGYSTLNSLFVIAPWIFLFLIPAVTMRLFADEKRMGTIELLLTKPITDMQIVVSKYLSGVLIVIISLLPTLIYFISVYFLGTPTGNIDTGGTIGSYIGLFFLASIYTAIGIFASSITANQVVAFIVAMLICFFFYTGFDSISTLLPYGYMTDFVLNIGIQEHYTSISRGVIDLRDITYYVAVIICFLLATRTVLESRKWN